MWWRTLLIGGVGLAIVLSLAGPKQQQASMPAATPVISSAEPRVTTLAALAPKEAPKKACTDRQGSRVADDVTEKLKALIDSTTVSCVSIHDHARCSLLCISPNTTTAAQRREILVWLVATAGYAIGNEGVAKSAGAGPDQFSIISYMDKTLGLERYTLAITAADANRIQSTAKADGLSPLQIVEAVEQAFARVNIETKP